MKNNNFTITTKKLAEICGVSQGTVDRALNNREGISERTRKRIIEAAKEYGYIEKKNIKPRLMGIVIFDLYNEYFSELVMSFEAECSRRGYSLVVMFTGKDRQREIDCINQLHYMGASGIIVCPVNGGEDFSRFLRSIGEPTVTVGNKLSGICHVGIDDFAAGYDAAAYLSKKSKRIIYYSPALLSDDNNFAQKERYYGFKAFCDENGVEMRVASSIKETEKLTSEGNWAIASSSDCHLAEILGRFPDAEVIGFDNLHSLSRFHRPIPSVDGHTDEVARLAVKCIEENSKESIVVRHEIVTNHPPL